MNISIVTTAILIIIALLALWGVGSWWVIKDIEEPKHIVLAERDGYEVREYAPYIVAEANVPAKGNRGGLNSGFMIVADYIFGNNAVGEKVAMTAPVLSEEKRSGEKIAMTAPVLSDESEAGERTIAFVMPSEYSIETLPKPKDERVRLREVPARTVAVSSFSWWASDARVKAKSSALASALARDNLTILNGPTYAGYNPPLSAPYIQRHEIMFEVEWNTNETGN